jgi:hypothetical protein
VLRGVVVLGGPADEGCRQAPRDTDEQEPDHVVDDRWLVPGSHIAIGHGDRSARKGCRSVSLSKDRPSDVSRTLGQLMGKLQPTGRCVETGMAQG